MTTYAQLEKLPTIELYRVRWNIMQIIQVREDKEKAEKKASRWKEEVYIDDVLQNQYFDWDIRWDKDCNKKVDDITEDDWFLHRNFWHIRTTYYFWQDKAITKKNYERFKKESQKTFNAVFNDIVRNA